jgi:hypothetical protein
MTFKEFLLLEENKRAYWQAINWFMSFVLSYLTYLATDGNVAWAVTALPIAKIISEMVTRYINKEKALGAFRK